MLEAKSVTVRELILALLGHAPDERAQLWYQQDNPMVEGSQPVWQLSVGQWDASDVARQKFLPGTIEHVWTATGGSWNPETGLTILPKHEYIANRPRSVYGSVRVSDLVSRLLDEDPDGALVMTGSYPLSLRVGRRLRTGQIYLQETQVWVN
jgi:hypothetical protein